MPFLFELKLFQPHRALLLTERDEPYAIAKEPVLIG
jgi:hypothetical protein